LSRTRSLWVLDEPFAGLDAQGTALARSVIERHLAGAGAALLSTHEDAGLSAGAVQCIELRP
jgi:heme exporter protein A